MMKERKTKLYARADHYLLIADATGIPVIASILEDLHDTAKRTCILEGGSNADEHRLNTSVDIRFIWIYNEYAQKGSLLAETVKQQVFSERFRTEYVAAEFSSVKEIHTYLRKEKH